MRSWESLHPVSTVIDFADSSTQHEWFAWFHEKIFEKWDFFCCHEWQYGVGWRDNWISEINLVAKGFRGWVSLTSPSALLFSNSFCFSSSSAMRASIASSDSRVKGRNKLRSSSSNELESSDIVYNSQRWEPQYSKAFIIFFVFWKAQKGSFKHLSFPIIWRMSVSQCWNASNPNQTASFDGHALTWVIIDRYATLWRRQRFHHCDDFDTRQSRGLLTC